MDIFEWVRQIMEVSAEGTIRIITKIHEIFG